MTTIAVLVSFNPDPEQLRRNIEALKVQVDEIVVVDNSPIEFDVFPINHYIWLPENAGVGRAQNLGVQRAIQLGADQVLFSDQDSHFYPDAVRTLSEALQSGSEVAAVGPVYRELNSNQLSSFFLLRGLGVERTFGASLNLGQTVKTDFLISSGMLMKVSAFYDVGEMREDYFIDYVDTEWCIRAISLGYTLLGVGGEMMSHQLGRACVKVWLGRWKSIAIHDEGRYYYIFRNGMWLIRDPVASLAWKRYLVTRSLFFGCVLALRLGGSWFGPLKLAFVGIGDGLKRVDRKSE